METPLQCAMLSQYVERSVYDHPAEHRHLDRSRGPTSGFFDRLACAMRVNPSLRPHPSSLPTLPISKSSRTVAKSSFSTTT